MKGRREGVPRAGRSRNGGAQLGFDWRLPDGQPAENENPSGDSTSDAEGSDPASVRSPGGESRIETGGNSGPAEQGTVERGDCYELGHPWHYLERGDNATPPRATQVPPNPQAGSAVGRDLPKQPAKRIVAARTLLDRDQAKLAETIREYEAVVERGADALSQYDREIAYRGDLEMARAGTIAILYNQIAWWRGRVQALERETDRGTSRRR